MLPKSCVSRTVRINGEFVSELKNHLIRTPFDETVSCSYGPIASNLEREKNVEDVRFALWQKSGQFKSKSLLASTRVALQSCT